MYGRRRAALFCEHESRVDVVQSGNVYPCYKVLGDDDEACRAYRTWEREYFPRWSKFQEVVTYLIKCNHDDLAGLCRYECTDDDEDDRRKKRELSPFIWNKDEDSDEYSDESDESVDCSWERVENCADDGWEAVATVVDDAQRRRHLEKHHRNLRRAGDHVRVHGRWMESEATWMVTQADIGGETFAILDTTPLPTEEGGATWHDTP